MIGRIYSVPFDAVSISAAQDLFMIAPADDKPVVLCGFTLDNVGGTADAGDAQEELLRLSIIRAYATVGSGGSAPTPTPLRESDAAAGFTARVNDTTVASTGSPISVAHLGWNIRVPLREFWPDELMPGCNQATGIRIVVRLVTAPADAISTSGTLYVAELS